MVQVLEGCAEGRRGKVKYNIVVRISVGSLFCKGIATVLRHEPNNFSAIVISYEDIGFFACDINGQHMANLPLDDQAVQGSRDEPVIALIDKNCAIVCIIATHLNIVVIIISQQKNIRKVVPVG